MNTILKLGSVLVTCFLFSAIARAETTARVITTLTTAEKINQTPEDKKFSLSTSLEYSEKVAADERAQAERGTDLTFAASYTINSTYSIIGNTVLTKELTGPQNTILSDTKLGLAVSGYKINPQLTTLHSISTTLPTSDESRTQNRLRAAFGITNGFSFDADLFKAKYKLGLSKNFHEYSQNAIGDFLTEYLISNSIELSYQLTEKIFIVGIGLYKTGFAYEKDQKYAFGIFGDLSYEFTKAVAVNIGFSNEGSAIKANGDTNISLFDNKISVLRAGVTYAY